MEQRQEPNQRRQEAYGCEIERDNQMSQRYSPEADWQGAQQRID